MGSARVRNSCPAPPVLTASRITHNGVLARAYDGSNPFFGGLIFPLSQTALSNIETGNWIKLMLIPISLGQVDLVQGPKVKLLASCEEVLGLGGCSVLLLQQLRRRWTFWFVNNVDLVPLTLGTFGTFGTLGTFGFRIGDEQRSLAIKPQVFGLFPRDRSLVKAVVAQHDEPFDGPRYASDVNSIGCMCKRVSVWPFSDGPVTM
jgi:hypothetical protein